MATRVDQEPRATTPGYQLLTDRGDPQRRRADRNVEVNIKVTQPTLERFSTLADANGWAFGKALERAVAALEMDLGHAK